MDNLKIGQIINTVQQKDAVHMAIVPVEAGEYLKPGEHIYLDSNKAYPFQMGNKTVFKLIGIVDPFLMGVVEPKQKFWLFLYPGSITSLRHDWTHPAFENEKQDLTAKDYSILWIKDFVKRINKEAGCGEEDSTGYTYETFMDMVRKHMCFGFDTPDFLYEDENIMNEFRRHYQIVTGEPTPHEYFRCAC